MMMIKKIAAIIVFIFIANTGFAQGCSDAGFCTIGGVHKSETEFKKQTTNKNEIDIAYIYSTHGKKERFHQPQINYRFIKKNGAFYEMRLPLNIAKNISNNLSTADIGDAILTYNSNFAAGKNTINYSVGFRASFTRSDKKEMKSMASYPMYLQSGLGTTDLIAVAGYDIGKYISIGTGVQVPVLQYNQHILQISGNSGTDFIKNFRRQPDALLKLGTHFSTGKFKINAGLLSIFHLANDYYKSSFLGKYILQNSQGTTINFSAEAAYAFTNKFMVSFLYAEPLKTRKSIPDGLARSRVFSPKITFAF